MKNPKRDRTDGDLVETLLRARRLLQPGRVDADMRTITYDGGRDGDVFYRDRWSHDRIVRSTHGVNCTGSCSWKVYVKDGIITWETQADRLPVGRPGLARVRAARVPARCGVLLVHLLAHPGPLSLCAGRTAGDVPRGERSARATRCSPGPTHERPRAAGAATRQPAARAASSEPAGTRRLSSIAAAQVHTIKTWGPDRIAGFSPIPAMSMASHAAGARSTSLLGGAMISFYDWYADLPDRVPPGLWRPDRRPRVRRTGGMPRT